MPYVPVHVDTSRLALAGAMLGEGVGSVLRDYREAKEERRALDTGLEMMWQGFRDDPEAVEKFGPEFAKLAGGSNSQKKAFLGGLAAYAATRRQKQQDKLEEERFELLKRYQGAQIEAMGRAQAEAQARGRFSRELLRTPPAFTFEGSAPTRPGEAPGLDVYARLGMAAPVAPGASPDLLARYAQKPDLTAEGVAAAAGRAGLGLAPVEFSQVVENLSRYAPGGRQGMSAPEEFTRFGGAVRGIHQPGTGVFTVVDAPRFDSRPSGGAGGMSAATRAAIIQKRTALLADLNDPVKRRLMGAEQSRVLEAAVREYDALLLQAPGAAPPEADLRFGFDSRGELVPLN